MQIQAVKCASIAALLMAIFLFNPALAAVRLGGAIGSYLAVLAIATFAISLVAFKPLRLMSIPSIADRNPRSQSL